MSSRVLREDTEQVREEITIAEFDGDQILKIKGKRNEENRELLERSVIGVATLFSSSEVILDHIISEGFLCLNIKPLGGMLHLTTFVSLEEKRAIIDSKWLLQWFQALLREVNKSTATLWRETWLTIYGVPLIA